MTTVTLNCIPFLKLEIITVTRWRWYALNPSTLGCIGRWISVELEASLIYGLSSRMASATQNDLLLKKTNKIKNTVLYHEMEISKSLFFSMKHSALQTCWQQRFWLTRRQQAIGSVEPYFTDLHCTGSKLSQGRRNIPGNKLKPYSNVVGHKSDWVNLENTFQC